MDRVHTAVYGYLRCACEELGEGVPESATTTQLLKQLRQEHSLLQDLGPRPDDAKNILNSLSNVLDALSPLRNKASLSHPNKDLLPEAEARLALNAAHTLFNYLESELRG